MPKRSVLTKTTWAVPGKRSLASKPAARRYVGSADGVHACLIRGVGSEILLRVYQDDAKRQFTDYDIWHDDLWVTIDSDAMAGFYKVGRHDVIDHAPQVLGLDATGCCRVRTRSATVSKTTRSGGPRKSARRGR